MCLNQKDFCQRTKQKMELLKRQQILLLYITYFHFGIVSIAKYTILTSHKKTNVTAKLVKTIILNKVHVYFELKLLAFPSLTS